MKVPGESIDTIGDVLSEETSGQLSSNGSEINTAKMVSAGPGGNELEDPQQREEKGTQSALLDLMLPENFPVLSTV